MKEIGANKYINGFINFSEFTANELMDFLKSKSANADKFKKLFDKVSVDILNKAFMTSGCNDYITKIHTNLLTNSNTKGLSLGVAVYSFIIDFLNDVESISAKFYYNIAEEELVYPILH